jgi:hypothetical protein
MVILIPSFTSSHLNACSKNCLSLTISVTTYWIEVILIDRYTWARNTNKSTECQPLINTDIVYIKTQM